MRVCKDHVRPALPVLWGLLGEAAIHGQGSSDGGSPGLGPLAVC